MIATASSSAGDHATHSSTTENDAKYREIFHFDDTPPSAKKGKPKYKKIVEIKTLNYFSRSMCVLLLVCVCINKSMWLFE